MELNKIEDEDNFSIKEILEILKKYKWIIIIAIIISISFASAIVYYKKPLYSAYSIVKVKQEGDSISKNLILNPKLEITTNIDEDISLLKTFYINNKALNLNREKFQIHYYTSDVYKSIEIYEKIPIKVKDIEIKKKSILGVKLRITPDKNGYYIDFVHSLKKKLMNRFFNKPLLKIKAKQPFKYNKKIESEFFTLRVDKFSNFSKPIDIILNGDNRYIYNNIIKDNLNIIQMNEKVPHIQIYYQDRVPTRAISYVESLTQSFINDSLSENSKQSNQILNFIKNELEQIKIELKKSEKELESYRVSDKAVQPSLQASTFIKKLSSIDFSLSENQLKIHIINNLMDFITKYQSFNSIAPSLIELEDKATLKLIGLLDKAELKRDGLMMDFTPKHPKVKEIDSRIGMIKNKIISNIKKLQKHIQEKEKNLRKRKKSYEQKLETLPIKERKIINIKRDYEVSSKMYNFLLEKQTENKILKIANMSKYKIIDKAYSDFLPIKNKSRDILLSSIVIGLVLGIILIVIYRIYSNKILSIKDIESRTDIPIYGDVPFIDINASSSIEKYNTLRTNLQLLDNELKVILLSSTTDNEGKEMVAINLGISFAKAGYRTVIIDLDIKNSIETHFPNMKIDDGIIYQTSYEHLDIIPMKKNSSISKKLLSQELPMLIKSLKINYDYIIINTTPFGTLTDTRHVMRFSDINLILFKEGYSYRTSIKNLNQIKKQNSISNLGVVFLQNS